MFKNWEDLKEKLNNFNGNIEKVITPNFGYKFVINNIEFTLYCVSIDSFEDEYLLFANNFDITSYFKNSFVKKLFNGTEKLYYKNEKLDEFKSITEILFGI